MKSRAGGKYILQKISNQSQQVYFSKTSTIAQDAALGRLNSWISLINGNVIVAGRIPLIDKFGYVARLVQKEVPMPR